MKRPEQKKIDEYLGCDTFCPWCNSDDITADSEIHSDVTVTWRDVSCNQCGAEWQDEHRLVAISWLEDGERMYSDETEDKAKEYIAKKVMEIDGFQELIYKLKDLAEKGESLELSTDEMWKHKCKHCGGVRGFLDWLQMGHDVIFFEREK